MDIQPTTRTFSSWVCGCNPKFYVVHAGLEWGTPKTIKQTKSRCNQKDPGQAEKQCKISKYNTKLIKYSSSTTKSALWGARGAPEGVFDRSRAVFDQFGFVFDISNCFAAWFYLILFDSILFYSIIFVFIWLYLILFDFL